MEGRSKTPAPESGSALHTAGFEAVVFELDAVLSGARLLHAQAWKRAFDEFFHAAGPDTEPPFSIETEYARCHGRPAIDAVEAVLSGRGIRLPRGTSGERPGHESIAALAALKHDILLSLLEAWRVGREEPTLDLVAEFRRRGLRTAVVSPSRACIPALAAAGALELFDAKVDGADAERTSLMPKPAPDCLTAIARELDIPTRRCMAVEASPEGVKAAREAGYGRVLALNREGPDQAEVLAHSGADVVIDDRWLGESDIAAGWPLKADDLAALEQRLADAAPALIVDYEGTLAPRDGLPGDDPRTERLRRVLTRLARRHPTAVISECDLRDLRDRLDVPGIIYAASDGLELELPDGRRESRRPATSGAVRDRGEALQHLLGLLRLPSHGRVIPVYLGDDGRDEDAFAVVDEHGVGISVGGSPPATIARFTLPDTDAVHRLLAWFSEQ